MTADSAHYMHIICMIITVGSWIVLYDTVRMMLYSWLAICTDAHIFYLHGYPNRGIFTECIIWCKLLIVCVAVQTKAWYIMSLSDLHYHSSCVTGAAVSLCLCWSYCHLSTAPQRTRRHYKSTCNRCIITVFLFKFVLRIPCGPKKLHCFCFIFVIALSELHLLRQFLAHIYSNKFSIIFIFHILYIIRDGQPA